MEYYVNGMISSGVLLGSKNSCSAALNSCWQSSTRWIPTAVQTRLLRELYYANRVRSPTAEQIQRITATLRRYGRIEGKNVFYWFQNHKARERAQNRKLTTTTTTTTTLFMTSNASATATPTMSSSNNVDCCNNMLTTIIGVVSAAAPGSVFIERSFRECCLAEDDSVVDRSNKNIVWVYHVREPTTMAGMHQCDVKEKEEESTAAAARETQILPLSHPLSRTARTV